ncbi:ClpP/crotonase [Thozetella sp. PMI_491]|nr:ClpP/crotonase [Thozetella sp. PMI_491]
MVRAPLGPLLFLNFGLALVSGLQVPSTAAGKQLGRWLEAFNTGDEATLLAYHDVNFPYNASWSVEVMCINCEISLRRKTGGYELKDLQDSEEHEIAVLLQERKAERFSSVRIRVDTTPLNQVLRFEMYPTKAPESFWSPEQRAARRLDPERRSRLVESVATQIEEGFAGKAISKDMGVKFRANLESGQYDDIDDIEELGRAFLNVTGRYQETWTWFFFTWPPQPGRFDDEEEELEWFCRTNYGFGNTTRHSHGIASIEIFSFIPSSLDKARDEISRRMSTVADATALIIDLRRNSGGMAATVALIASHLFGNEKTHLNNIYTPQTDTIDEIWTDPAVSGSKFGPSKPLYILIGNRTFCEGEGFAYELQALKRGIVVGETTNGIARIGSSYEIEPGFIMMMPSKYPINPVTGTNWEGVGVVPDIIVREDSALEEALRRAEEDLGVAGLRQDEKDTADEGPQWEDL